MKLRWKILYRYNMEFKLWLEETGSMPIMYHGSPKKRETLQPGSMLTIDPMWAIGYTTKINYNTPGFDEIFTGKIHVVKLNPKNPFTVNGHLHDAEYFLINMMPNVGGGLSNVAKMAHKQFDYDAIIARYKGKIDGAITLVEIPVQDWIDPVEFIESHPGPSHPGLKDHYDSMMRIAKRTKEEA